MIKTLRICASVICLLASVLLFAMWLRSYQWHDQVIGSVFEKPVFHPTYGWHDQERVVCLTSFGGILSFSTWDSGAHSTHDWSIESDFAPPRVWETRWLFEFNANREGDIHAPHWFLVALSAAIGIALGATWSTRFSLRTLFVAITLIAIFLSFVATLP